MRARKAHVGKVLAQWVCSVCIYFNVSWLDTSSVVLSYNEYLIFTETYHIEFNVLGTSLSATKCRFWSGIHCFSRWNCKISWLYSQLVVLFSLVMQTEFRWSPFPYYDHNNSEIWWFFVYNTLHRKISTSKRYPHFLKDIPSLASVCGSGTWDVFFQMSGSKVEDIESAGDLLACPTVTL